MIVVEAKGSVEPAADYARIASDGGVNADPKEMDRVGFLGIWVGVVMGLDVYARIVVHGQCFVFWITWVARVWSLLRGF